MTEKKLPVWKIEEIDYQKDSIVSRELRRTEDTTVTLFAFDEGQGLSEHTAPFDAYVQIIDGSARITIASEIYNLEKGEMIRMPANEPHALFGENKFKMLLTMFKKGV